MDEYKKYPIHGVYKFDSFREETSRDISRFEKDIPPIAGIRYSLVDFLCIKLNVHWFFSKFILRIQNHRTGNGFVWPQCEFGPSSDKFDEIISQQFLRYVNETPENSMKYEFKDSSDLYYAPFYWDILYLREILEEDSGWLKDGTLKIEYGVYVKKVKIGKLWKFNFWDPLFDCDKKQKMITLKTCGGKLLYTHKQLLTFHSPKYYTVPPDWNVVDQQNSFKAKKMEICLQLVHGVRMKLDEPQLKSIIPIARSMKLYNVVHYCQYQLMTFEESVDNLKFAFKFNTRHYSIHLMKKLESREELKEILKGMDIQNMSGESMKQCTIIDSFLMEKFE